MEVPSGGAGMSAEEIMMKQQQKAESEERRLSILGIALTEFLHT